ncbi:uncharacterized protein DUF3616 [Salegentibacter sp. 24]|uniref:DUF3616 domain-containing protein n=1 Tax=Salegentibacter sp. 24 TaxID=2183986 RepID=UPI00105C2102|nr:DUF3616 domain-containing protein [Salegentibacter sp. 24]TDN87416.1 uncharacterized protein DUF3616 [Salegentibacter sp. 24]
MRRENVIIDFEEASRAELLDKNIRDGVSSIACTGKYLWVAGDENISIQRLEILQDGSYGKACNYFLKDFIDLPSEDDEADVEGMDVYGNYLWIVGSHSYKRKKVKPESEDAEAQIERLCKTKLGPNRNLLARIPIIKNEAGEFTLMKECPDPSNPKKILSARKLKHSKKKWSQLTKKLIDDRHIGSFIGIPGKDNGFDIEGLAVLENRIFLGLRGPVLRGWAIIIEIELKETEPHLLELKKNKKTGKYLKKHFINLHGMGIRELVHQGKDLLVLAGPTMDLDGTMEIYRWKNACDKTDEQVVKRSHIESIFVFPYRKEKHGIDKAEGLALRDDNNLLIAYDSPDQDRKIGENKVRLDLISLDQPSKKA